MKNNYLSIRQSFYKEHFERELSKFNINLYSFTDNPYTKLKSYYYIEIGALFIYLLLKTNIKPNSITLFYALLGIVGVILLLFNTIETTIIALFIFFSKNIPDWIDGYIARIKNKTSTLGSWLDEWGASVNLLCFQIGVIIYLVNASGDSIYYIIGIIIAILNAMNFKNFILKVSHYSNKKLNLIIDNDKTNNPESRLLKVLKNVVYKLRYDGRSRYTDLVILIILVELYYGQILLSFIIAWIWLILSIINFFYSIKQSFNIDK